MVTATHHSKQPVMLLLNCYLRLTADAMLLYNLHQCFVCFVLVRITCIKAKVFFNTICSVYQILIYAVTRAVTGSRSSYWRHEISFNVSVARGSDRGLCKFILPTL